MAFNRILLVTAVAGLSLLSLPPVHAADNDLGGKAVPGVCMLSREQVIGQSKVGQAADARMKHLADQARSQLDTERKPLQNEIQQFQQQAQKMSDTERKQKGQALQERLQAFRQRAQGLNERIQLTRQSVMKRIGHDLQPVVAEVYKHHDCGLLLDRNSVLGGNMKHDLTDDVIQALDKKVSTISFNLEPLPKGNNNGNGQ